VTKLIDVRIPAGQQEGTHSQVLRWLKAVGDDVELDEPLLELETDKVTVEIPAPAAGVLREILKQPEQDVGPGEAVARLEARTHAPSGPPGAGAAAPEPQVSSPTGGRGPLRLSPSVRRLLRKHSVTPAQLAGSGRDARITAADVERFVAAQAADTGPVTERADLGIILAATTAANEPGIDRVPHTSMRKRIAQRMVESLLHTAPHVTTLFEADLGAVLAHRARHRADYAQRGAPLTLTAYFMQACIAAIRAVPEANARWTADALEVYRHIDIGIATALEGRGLVVPVLRRADALDLKSTAERLADLTQRARTERLTPADVRTGTFTISNHGVSGSLLATPIVINQPQSAILGIGRLEKRVVVIERDGEDVIAIRPRCYVTLTLDHRVMDGDRANLFLSTFVRHLAQWGR
jgi:2-oxoglutarate dehydrogenase E2 component (dihydrolipoamide succinyltransferase)